MPNIYPKAIVLPITAATLFLASPAEAALPSSVDAGDGTQIAISIRDDISKIRWEDQYITFVQFDESKIAEVEEKFSGIDVQAVANRGISGDFLTVSAQRHGNIKTDYGNFEIIWTNIAGSGYGAVISNGNDYKEVKLFDIDDKKSVIFGNFADFIGGGMTEDKQMALALIKKQNIFEGRPELYTNNEVISLADYKITWENKWTQEREDLQKIVGHLNDFPGTEIDIYATSAGARYLTLEDGTRLFTKMTANPDVSLLFYIDFDNNKDNKTVTFVTIGSVQSSQFGPTNEYDKIFADQKAKKTRF